MATQNGVQNAELVSVVVSIFIIFVIWLFKKYKYFNQRLILALSVAALGASISYMLTDVPQEGGPLCQFQAWLIEYFVLAILLWVCCITFNIWKALRGVRATRLERLYHLISWGIPLVVASVPFSEDVYGPAGPWCWVAGNVKNSVIWRFSIYYIPLFVCITGLFVAYIYIFITHRKRVKRWEGVHHGNNAVEHEQRKVLMNYVNSMLAYPFIYLVLSLAPVAHRIYNAVSSEPSFVLILLHVISIPLTGLINAVAFGLNSETLSRLNWADMKAALQQHFPFGNSRLNSSMGEHRLGEQTCTVLHQDVHTINEGYNNNAL